MDGEKRFQHFANILTDGESLYLIDFDTVGPVRKAVPELPPHAAAIAPR